jgi:uncharacterized membrane protein
VTSSLLAPSLRQSRTLHTLTGGPKSGIHFRLRIEKIANGLVAVFIPGAPNPEAGAVYFVTPDRVRLASIPLAAALNCLKHHGVGSNALLHDISTEQ